MNDSASGMEAELMDVHRDAEDAVANDVEVISERKEKDRGDKVEVKKLAGRMRLSGLPIAKTVQHKIKEIETRVLEISAQHDQMEEKIKRSMATMQTNVQTHMRMLFANISTRVNQSCKKYKAGTSDDILTNF